MKLVYLWIESYQYIKKQGYLLHAGYEVRYDSETGELFLTKRKSIDCLLYGENIAVTAIVGDNGAGKSTLLDAIRLVLFDERERGREIKGFLLWENEGKLELFSFMEGEICVKSEISYKRKTMLPDFNLVYYSDFLDIKYYLEEFDDGEDGYTYAEKEQVSFRNRNSVQQNISSSYLLRQIDKGVLDYFHGDIKRQIAFYGSLQGGGLPFPHPAALSVKIEFLDVELFDRVLDASLQAYEYMGMRHKGEINTNAFVIGLLKEMESVYQSKIISNREPLEVLQILQWDIWVTYLYNLLANRKQEHEEVNDYSQVDEIIKQVISPEVRAEDFFEELDKTFSYKESIEENFDIYLEFYQKTRESLQCPKTGNLRVNFDIPNVMMQNLKEKVLRKYLSSDTLPNLKMDSPLSFEDAVAGFPKEYMKKNGWDGDWDMDVFMDFYECYTKISYEIDFLKFSWGMSSGESSMFNLFARLYATMKKEEKEKIILLFDELDSSFHPQWQQAIISSLTGFLRSMYPQKEFQLILTTHSPVLLSDIPRENVIFMRKENIGETEHEQTFAANIASLYYDSFFMKKGSIGEVARGSIANLLETISELEEEEKEKGELEGDRGKRLVTLFLQKQYPNVRKNATANSDETLILLQKLIDSIGEDIWRYKVNEKLHHFLKSDAEHRKKEIWNRLKELEQKEGKASVKALVEQWLREEER